MKAINTLPDYLADGIDIMAIGLNPSPNSVRAGYPYATSTNRFWPALNASRLVAAHYHPSIESMRRLLRDERIGFTDVVKRPTPGSADLRAADYRQWAPVLLDKLARFKPRIVWIQGKGAYTNLLRYGLGKSLREVPWGAQQDDCGSAAVFVTPNPSAANAVYSLADITTWIDALADFRATLTRRTSCANRRAP